MRSPRSLQHAVVGLTALVFAGAYAIPGNDRQGPVLAAAVEMVSPRTVTVSGGDVSSGSVDAVTKSALEAFAGAVRPLSRSHALEDAFRSYFAYRTEHPDEVRKPYLYFVDYGLPSTTPRGYVFDMERQTIVDGPFTVAHGRGSSTSRYGIPTRFSNVEGSAATSLGLYVAKATYAFRGTSGGRRYTSIGVRMEGVSRGFNDRAMQRGVVTHGAPYVTSSAAGRSEGCPAMEQERAQRLLPKIAHGGMVFLFAPDEDWRSRDPWLTADAG
jgi:hypothetical protein